MLRAYQLEARSFIDNPTHEDLRAMVAEMPNAKPTVYGNLDVDRRGHRHVIKPPAKASRRALDFNNIGLIAPGTMFARWALEKVGDLDEDFHMEMDLDLSLRLRLATGEPTTMSVWRL